MLNRTVDCSRGQSITRALEHAPPGIKLMLTVRGTCNESVLIERDDVTLQGDPVTGAVLTPPPAAASAIDIRAMRVAIDRLTIQGGSNGIRITGAHDASIAHTVVRNVAGRGIVVRNAHAIVLGSMVEGSGAEGVFLMRGSVRMADSQIRSNRGVGIDLVNAAGLNVTTSTIASNGSAGIRLSGGCQATIDGNTIISNGFSSEASEAGVSVSGASNAQISGSSILNNAGAGLHVLEGSVVTASQNTITGNGGNGVLASENSHVSLWSSTIEANGTNAGNDVNNRNGVAAFFSNLNLGGNQVTNHPAAGVRVIVSSFNGGGNTISGNTDGVVAYNAKLVVHPGDAIVDNRNFGLLLNQTSSAQIAGARIQNNASDGILLQWASALVLVDPATTSGGNGGYGLRCPDAKSSVVGLQLLLASPANGQGGVSPTCTGF
jgi:hypothetical protein